MNDKVLMSAAVFKLREVLRSYSKEPNCEHLLIVSLVLISTSPGIETEKVEQIDMLRKVAATSLTSQACSVKAQLEKVLHDTRPEFLIPDEESPKDQSYVLTPGGDVLSLKFKKGLPTGEGPWLFMDDIGSIHSGCLVYQESELSPTGKTRVLVTTNPTAGLHDVFAVPASRLIGHAPAGPLWRKA